jgi:hypothetical protein
MENVPRSLGNAICRPTTRTIPDPIRRVPGVVFSPDLQGCSSFSYTGIKVALANLVKVRWLWIDGPIQSKANIPEPTERGNTS